MNLFDKIKWKKYQIPSSAAYGSLSLKIGVIGDSYPCASLIAGVHGDEGPWGALSIKNVLETIQDDELVGTIKIVPVANPTAMEADSRVSPIDHLDLNRVFPGDLGGSHTQRIAAIITKHVLDGSDYVFDIHGGGSWCVNSFAFRLKGSENLVDAVNPPFIVESTKKPGTLTSYSLSNGAKVTAIEMGGRCQFENDWIIKLANGLKRALKLTGVINSENLESQNTQPQLVGPTKTLRSNKGGIFIPNIKEETVGTIVRKGSILGTLINPVTMDCEQIFKSPFEKTAVLLLRPRISVVEGGAMIYVVAPLTEVNKK